MKLRMFISFVVLTNWIRQMLKINCWRLGQ